MKNALPYIHRDISWLSFNYRVLQEAKDVSVPLLERLKFLAIYSSNLDEYFRVRVANHKFLVRAGKKTKRNFDFDPKKILNRIADIVNEQQEEISKIFTNEIVPELRKYGIHLKRRLELNKEQLAFVENYFNETLVTYLEPVLLFGDKIKPFLNNAELYLSIQLRDKDTSNKKTYYALLRIPTESLGRFIKLPSENPNLNEVIMLDDIVRQSVQWIFPGFEIIDTYSIKLTRDAELYIDDEYSGDLIDKVKKSLSKRDIGPASRLVYDRDMPKDFIDYLSKSFEIEKGNLYPEGRYHNNFDFFRFPSFGKDFLKNNPLPPLPIEELEESESIFDIIKKKDHFVFVPYQSYESVIKFFEDAAKDPKVTHIKIVQYRVAKISRIMDALMYAVKTGKQVSAFVEIKARFDEEANLVWGEKLEKAGVNVHYSMPGLKVHSKLALVRRLEANGPQLYNYLSTGNFHEDTAKVYSDMGLFTADPRITYESTRVFAYLETKQLPSKPFEHLAVGKFNLKQKLVELIKQETKNAQAGKKAKIIVKLNSIEDKEMIDLLYKASQAGVIIKMIVRGICSIIPGVKGISENISIISIVDRFLEHSRVFIFDNDGDPKVYLSSADWMVRNLHYRIETMFPIYDMDIKKQILDIINIQLSDNMKARIVDVQNNNNYTRDNSDFVVRSQLESYYYMKRKLEERKRILTDQEKQSVS